MQIQKKEADQMIGADISFLPELEAKGMKFSDKGVEKDAIRSSKIMASIMCVCGYSMILPAIVVILPEKDFAIWQIPRKWRSG